MQLAVFTDEIHRQDPACALELAAAWGVPCVEVRGLAGGRFPRVADAELGDFGRRVTDAGLRVSGVSPGLFKCAVDDPSVGPGLDRDLPRACEWAQRWGSDLVSCFGFARGPGEPPAVVVDRLGEMARIAATCQCRLVLENEAVCWGATGLEAAALIRRIGHPNLRLCWDPGNSARAGSRDPYPGEYGQLRDLVAHVHLKNYQPGPGRWSPMEVGIVDWPGQLAALARDGYHGFLVLETHTEVPLAEFGLENAAEAGLTPREAATHRNLAYLRALLAGAP